MKLYNECNGWVIIVCDGVWESIQQNQEDFRHIGTRTRIPREEEP